MVHHVEEVQQDAANVSLARIGLLLGSYDFLHDSFQPPGNTARAYFVKKHSTLEDSNLEKLEMLEQLRILESGFKIKVTKKLFQRKMCSYTLILN